MKTRALKKEISRLESDLVRQNQKLTRLKRKLPPTEVEDYVLAGPGGKIRLTGLFQGKRDLVVVHNMGRSCPYCTLWADGFNGLREHLADRAGFAVVSPDTVATQQKFAASRGWKFPFYSGRGSSFIKDMGFLPKPDEPMPGVSTFYLEDGKIFRVASAPFGAFDPFSPVWPMIALLRDGINDWSPKFRYRRA